MLETAEQLRDFDLFKRVFHNNKIELLSKANRFIVTIPKSTVTVNIKHCVMLQMNKVPSDLKQTCQ